MRKVVCIGAGKLAFQLMPALAHAGCEIIQVYNRTPAKARQLAEKLSIPHTTSQIEEITPEGDLYFLCIADDSISDFSRQLKTLDHHNAIFVHCSGVMPLDILPFSRRGIFYPLQTFSKAHEVDWKTVPILLTTEDDSVMKVITGLAESISDHVYPVTDEDKAVLHLGAVFANNFSNHALTLAEQICQVHGLDFSMLKPLIRETFEKALAEGPSLSQTGPAIRGDEMTITKHLQLLENQPALRRIYQIMTESLQQLNVKE